MKVDPLDEQLAASIRGDIDEAWRLSQLLEKERPNDRRAAFNRGWHMFRLGDLKRGFELIENGRAEGVYGSPALKTNKPQWTGKEDLRGKTILLRGEGGFGDEIINIRFAKLLEARGARVIASASDGIVSLLKRISPTILVIPHRLVETAHFDYWVPAMSIPMYLDLTYETLPGDTYLTAEPKAVAAWANIITSPKMRIGIRWSGNPKFEHEQHRRFPTEPLFELAKLDGVQLYSLQRDHDLRDLPDNIIDLQNLLSSWDDTAAAIENMDLVITSCTSVAHLSAAMGKETWIIVPVLPYQVWALPGDTSPWYKSVRLFRQEKFGSWDETFAKLRAALTQKVASFTPREGGDTMPVPIPKKPMNAPVTPFGIHLAPKPTPKTSTSRSTNKNILHFVAGLPRSGSTALMSLLAQNPRFFAAPISGLSGIFSGVHANWDKGEFHIELPNPEAKRRVLRAILENYHATDKPVVIDKDRQWMMHMPLLEELLERPIKVITPVRPIPEILTSFETLRRKNILEFTGADEALGPSSTIETRAAYFADAKGPMGLAYNAMKDAVTSGYLDRMLFVDYNKLMSAPKMQLKRIYEFLEEPYFEHDFAKVEQIAKGDSRVHKFPGLHDVRPEFKKTSASAREVLGDVYSKYDTPEPWAPFT